MAKSLGQFSSTYHQTASGLPSIAPQGGRRWSSHASGWAAPSPPTCSPTSPAPSHHNIPHVITLSVQHILLHCVRYDEERQPLAALTHTTLLGEEHPDVLDRLMIYLTETYLIRELWFTCICYTMCDAPSEYLKWMLWWVFIYLLHFIILHLTIVYVHLTVISNYEESIYLYISKELIELHIWCIY